MVNHHPQACFQNGVCSIDLAKLAFPAPEAGQWHKCGRTPQGGKPCNHMLDELGRHAGLCNKGLYTRRRALVRDRIVKVARQAGFTAQIEQKMLIQGQTQEDGEPAPGRVRPLHRADVHITEPTGAEFWIDVRIHTAHVDQPIAMIGRGLLREEHQKGRAYVVNMATISTGWTKEWFQWC